MSRNRMIKPSFWTSEQIVECSISARLMFLGLLNFCDDNGIHALSYKATKMEIFPGDDFTTDQIKSMYQELIDNELVHVYTVENKQYFIVTGWHHQKIDKPSYLHPLPEGYTGYIRQLAYDSSNGSRAVPEHSTPKERKGKERKEKEVKTNSASLKTAISKDFSITDQMRAFYKTKNYVLTIESATEKWVNACRSNGYKYVDWYAAWQNGMLKAHEWHLRDNPNIVQMKGQAPKYRASNDTLAAGMAK
jgi:hypothetical protein